MPFTFSHPAIILPFLKEKKLSATGLIIGSLCPDFEYFIRMKVQSDCSHTFLGLFFFNLPVGLLFALVFHQIIKKPFIENLPLFFQNKLTLLKSTKWMDYLKTNFLNVLLSILIGAISHVLWDSFTHKSGYFVAQIPFLRLQINSIPLYKIMQHLSSLIGMIFILYYGYKLPDNKVVAVKSDSKYWIFVVFFSFLFMLIRLHFGLSFSQIGAIVVSLIGTTILGIIVASLLFRKTNII
ncbi:DUF4184 family protein [Flavobacterium restrictum]|uniref:DUF4184 family protein n=1 Tax=Flavobacterium restrictum TaxID=2594428 RepID=A0A553E388_9FLAO|nr:DUF4184 family protein [Flavobacterium restrictum]TRX39497.1 DUF4184 family protein [Flavobacterium restrictum]